MWQYFLLLFFYSGLQTSGGSGDSGSDTDDENLVSSLRNDANLDLSVDADYEDLRAELLAYHTALASLPQRRSLLTTPCWQLGGICVKRNLCIGFRYLTEVPGCKNKLNVCCFAWNRFQARDMKDKGIGNVVFPWSLREEFGGEGVVIKNNTETKKKKKGKKQQNEKEPIALILRDDHNNEVILI